MMKWITILFLLMNVGYFGLQMNQSLEQAVPMTASKEKSIQTSNKPLILLSELDELPPLRKEDLITETIIESSSAEANLLEGSEVGQGLPFTAAGSCLSIGSFKTEESREFNRWLISQSIPFRQRTEEKRTRERYWVYLKPQAESEAKAQLEELKRKGLTDYYMISKGDMKNAISLGLFSLQSTVNQRLVELKKEGYSPVVVPQHKITTFLWFDIQISEEIALPVLPNTVKTSKIDCQEIALLNADQ